MYSLVFWEWIDSLWFLIQSDHSCFDLKTNPDIQSISLNHNHIKLYFRWHSILLKSSSYPTHKDLHLQSDRWSDGYHMQPRSQFFRKDFLESRSESNLWGKNVNHVISIYFHYSLYNYDVILVIVGYPD